LALPSSVGTHTRITTRETIPNYKQDIIPKYIEVDIKYMNQHNKIKIIKKDKKDVKYRKK